MIYLVFILALCALLIHDSTRPAPCQPCPPYDPQNAQKTHAARVIFQDAYRNPYTFKPYTAARKVAQEGAQRRRPSNPVAHPLHSPRAI